MERWRGLGAVPSGWGRCVVTLGVYDGVHRGHQQIIGRAVEQARRAGLPSVLVTFDPHPSEVVRPGSHPAVLTTLDHRAQLVEALGVDVLVVLPFTSALQATPPEQFAHEVLVDGLHAAAVVVGENFRFGARAEGDLDRLAVLGRRFGFTVEGVTLLAEDDGTVLSSTYVRACVAAGDLRAAAQVLGRAHRVEGVVVRGDRRGRELGYPTANLRPVPWAAVPADGVYATWMHLDDGRRFRSATSIGTNPTFAGTERRVEAFVMGERPGDPPPSPDLYGEHLALDLVERVRPQERFDDVEALVAQMALDVVRCREVLDATA